MTWITQIFDLLYRPFIWWVVIAPWEMAVRSRLGKNLSVLHPGIHWRFPFIDRVYTQSVRLRMLYHPGQTMTSKDGKVCTIAIALQYAINDIEKLYREIANPESTIIFQAQGLIAKVISESDSSVLTLPMIEEAVAQQVPAKQWGLGQFRVWITSFAYVKTYRIMNDGWHQPSMNNDLDNQQHVK